MKRIVFFCCAAVCAFGQQYDYATQVKNKPTADMREYNWVRKNGAGVSADLSASGAGKVLAFTKSPAGVNSFSPNAHTVYISGGTGTAEAVTITATTCTAANQACTMTVTTAQAHTGAWTVASGTEGLQEAIYAAPWRTISIPNGNHVMRGCVTIPVTTHMVRLQGEGWMQNGTYAAPTSPNGTVLNFAGAGTCTGYITANLAGIASAELTIKDVYIVGGGQSTSGDGIHVENLAAVWLDRVYVAGFAGHGVYLNRAIASSIENSQVAENGKCGILMYRTVNGGLIRNSGVSGNSKADGYANVCVQGSSNLENLAVTLDGVRMESAAYAPYPSVTPSNSGGLSVNYTQSISIRGCYFENNRQYNARFDVGTRGVTMTGNFINGAEVNFLAASELKGYGNTWYGAAATYVFPSNAQVASVGPDVYVNGATNPFGTTSLGQSPIQVRYTATGQTANITAQALQLYGGYRLQSGTYRVSVYIVTTTAGSAGTLDLTVASNDALAARTWNAVTGMSLTTTAAVGASAVIRQSSSYDLTFSTVLTGATGNPQYAVYITVERLQ